MTRIRLYSLCVVAVLFAALLAGCEIEQRVVKRSGWTKMFAESEWNQSAVQGSDNRPAAQRNRGYAIELGRYSGAQAYYGVTELMRSARQDAGLANLWYATLGQETAVYVGRFVEEDSAQAKAALRQVREAEIDGKALFGKAKIVKLGSQQGQALDPRDLRSLKGKGLFSLQIGYYDTTYGPDFRRAVETAVDVLRDEGEQAYYYHGPHRSMVLVHAWTRAQAFTLVGQIDHYSDTVRRVQETYPHNVPNGRPFTDADDPAYVRSQKSFLVPIR